MFADIGQSRVWKNEKQRLLGITIYINLEEHIIKLYKKKQEKNVVLW